MKLKYFGTDGIRGKSYIKLNANLAYRVGQSLKEAFNSNKVVIGLDTRDSSPMLANMIAAGAMSVGLDVLYAGVIPTPLIAHYSLVEGITGVMITASHNPYTDNGIKLFNKGYKSTSFEELIVESYIDGKEPEQAKLGQYILALEEVKKEYLKVIDKLDLRDSNLKIAYDSANGANYLLSNEIISTYFKNSIQINNDPDGQNINRECGSTYLDSIKTFVIDNEMDLGFSFDGDGDRVLMVGNNGKTYDGDMINYIIATHLKTLGKLKNNTVVLTKMTNPGILKALRDKEIDYILTDVGDKYVFREMVENDLILGGESSGHIILRNLLHSGDGLLAALFILKTLIEENLSLEDIINEVTPYPFEMINIPNIDKNILNSPNVISRLKSYEDSMSENDLFLIRASGTEDLIRVTISCEDGEKLKRIIREICDYLSELKN